MAGPESLYGYLTVQNNNNLFNQRQQVADAQQAHTLAGILEHQRGVQEQEAIKNIFAQAGGDIQAALPKLPSTGPMGQQLALKIQAQLQTQQQNQIHGALYQAQALKNLQQSQILAGQEAAGQRAGAQLDPSSPTWAPQGDMPRPDVVVPAMTDQEAWQKMKEASAAGQPLTIGVPNQGTLRANAVQMNPAIGRALLSSMQPPKGMTDYQQRSTELRAQGLNQHQIDQQIRAENTAYTTGARVPVGNPQFQQPAAASDQTQSGAPVGMPAAQPASNLPPAAQAKIAVATESARGKADVKLQFEKPQAKLRVDTMTQNFDKLDSALAELDKSPGLERITGPIFGRMPSITEAGTGAQTKLDSILSQTFVSALQSMREASKTGGAVGNVSDREGERLQNTLAALGQSQSTADFRIQLQNARDQLRQSKRLINRAYEQQFGHVQSRGEALSTSAVTGQEPATPTATIPKVMRFDEQGNMLP